MVYLFGMSASQASGVNLITLAEHFGWVLNLLGPRQVTDMDEAVDTFLNTNEDTEVSDVTNLTKDARPNGVSLVEKRPWVRLSLLHTK